MSTIVLISHDLGAGGVQRKIADVARCLTTGCEPSEGSVHRVQSAEHRVYVVLKEGPPLDEGDRAFFDSVAASAVRIRCRPKARAGFLALPFPVFCFWCVLTLHPQRVIGFLRGPGLIAVMLRWLFWWRDIRVGISDDSFPSGAIEEQTHGAAHAAILRQLMRVGYARADWVAAPSEAAKADLIRTFSVPAERVLVSRNWVGLTSGGAGPAATTPEDGAASAMIPRGGFDLIYVGRLAPVKNLPLLVETVRDLREACPSVRAVIVGGGPGRLELERQRAQLGLEDHLTFAGWQRDVTPWLAASRLFCITSHHEGLPIAALEAMALGLPVISTRYPGAEELVRDGETGFLCRDGSELVDRIVRCLTHESMCRELGQRARELVATRYGPENLRRFVQLITQG